MGFGDITKNLMWVKIRWVVCWNVSKSFFSGKYRERMWSTSMNKNLFGWSVNKCVLLARIHLCWIFIVSYCWGSLNGKINLLTYLVNCAYLKTESWLTVLLINHSRSKFASHTEVAGYGAFVWVAFWAAKLLFRVFSWLIMVFFTDISSIVNEQIKVFSISGLVIWLLPSFT